MAAHYDTYDYPAYWDGREYEHNAEIIAVKSFLNKIPHKIKKVVELGGGYGRLVPSYIYRADKIILTDPSRKLLSIADKNLTPKLKKNKIQFVQSRVEFISKKLRGRTADLIIIVRVLHHITDIDKAFNAIDRLSKKNGYLILEFANKMHAKAALSELCHGNFTFPLDIFPRDIRSQKSVDEKTLPFVNYHPDIIMEKLKKYGFKVIEKRSVSNVRSQFLKRILPREVLLFIEKYLQVPFARFYFGPSVFVLAKKVG